MKYRSLPRAGLKVSEIGFGTWGLGGDRNGSIGYGPTDDRESLRALRRACELGVTFYDTADLYGGGHSEVLLGRALAFVRSRMVVATKAGFLGPDGAQDFSPSRLEAALRESLRRLRTDHVDLFQLHSPPIEALASDPGILHWLRGLKRAGMARAVGISVRAPDDRLTVAGGWDVDAIQVNFSLADQRAARNGLLERCTARGIGVIVRTPLCFGFLTGAFGPQTAFAAADHRSRWAPEQRARWHDASTVFSSCRSGQTAAQLALRYGLSYPGVATVIPGMLTPAHVEENVRASDLGPLSPGELQQVEELYEQHDFYVAKRHGEPGASPPGGHAIRKGLPIA